jgi:FYVE zinc finger
MAANYSAQQTYPISQSQTPFYPTQQLSPLSSISPTSPRMNDYIQQHAPNPYKQIRQLKSPLYVPAALRPTEHFSTPTTPATPPKSQHGSLDSLQDAEANAAAEAAQTQLEIDALGTHWVIEEELGEVTGLPTREHWKPDNASPQCDSPHCFSNFNLFVRKHHCRHCGHIFCATHVTRTIPLDQNAQFHPDGTDSRACEMCHRQYIRWDAARSLRRKNSQNSKDDDSGPPTPLAGPGSYRRMISGGIRGKQPEQMANSVPKDWAWSTF